MSAFFVSFLPLVIIFFLAGALRSQKRRPDSEARRREIAQNLAQKYQTPSNAASPQTRPPAPPRPTATYQVPPPRPPLEAQELRYILTEPPSVQADYTNDFKNAYYRAQGRGKDFDPWELPPEKGPWGF